MREIYTGRAHVPEYECVSAFWMQGLKSENSSDYILQMLVQLPCNFWGMQKGHSKDTYTMQHPNHLEILH